MIATMLLVPAWAWLAAVMVASFGVFVAAAITAKDSRDLGIE